jgi:hypothetical protein
MAFPSDVPVAAVGTPVAGTIPSQFALTQTVEIVPQNQVTIIAQSNKSDGSEEIIVNVRKRFTRATPGSGAWAEAAL